MHLTGQGIAARLTHGGLAQVFFAPPAAYIDKIRLSLALPTISCLIRMSKKQDVQLSVLSFLSADLLYSIMLTIDAFVIRALSINVAGSVFGAFCGC